MKRTSSSVVPSPTKQGLKPADFPLGSVESRAAARAIVQRLTEKHGPQPGDITIDLTFLTPERAGEICRVLRALHEESAKQGWDKIPPNPNSPSMWLKWPEGFDADAVYKNAPALTIDEVTDDNLRDILGFYRNAYRKAKDDGVPLPPRLDPDLEWNGIAYVPKPKN